MHYKRLITGHKITQDSNYSLLSVKSFHIDKQRVLEFEAYAKQLFMAYDKS